MPSRSNEIEGYSGTRKRVLFDEVLLVTLDRRRRLGTIAILAAVTLVLLSPGLLIAVTKRDLTFSLIWTGVVSPAWIALLVHLAFGVDQVTVFGKRTSAQMRFALRKRRAREVFALLRARVGEVQRAVAQPVPPASESSGTAAA
jgi:hypothetical protein